MFSYNLKLKNFFPIAEEVKIISIQHESKIDLSKYKKTKSKKILQKIKEKFDTEVLKNADGIYQIISYKQIK
tara:strand:- start:1134 stop:1349 length:216 start_codon:yes stop_codon:yes gene_type:complete